MQNHLFQKHVLIGKDDYNIRQEFKHNFTKYFERKQKDFEELEDIPTTETNDEVLTESGKWGY